MQLRCVCGRAIEVPPLTELQRAQAAGAVCQATEPREPPPADELAAAADDEMPREFLYGHGVSSSSAGLRNGGGITPRKVGVPDSSHK